MERKRLLKPVEEEERERNPYCLSIEYTVGIIIIL
jgi:hypothetical protein